jgi:hypothetical protein
LKIGNKEIPTIRLPPLLDDLKTLYEKTGVSDVDAGVIAEFLGHKSSTSGTFLTKLASMKDFGLIEGRGKLRITTIGQRLSEPKTPEEQKNQAAIDAISKVSLWRIIFEKYTKNGLEIPEADFWNDLRESCVLTIEEAKKLSPSVLADYKEDIKPLRSGLSIIPPMNTNLNANPNLTPPPPPVPEGMTTVAYGDWKVILPKDDMGDAWATLKAMVDAIIETKAKKKPSS